MNTCPVCSGLTVTKDGRCMSCGIRVDPIRVAPKAFNECERGNTLLHDGNGGFVAWFVQEDDQLLEISYQPDNYPKLNVNTVELTDEQLAEHINQKCQGWTIDKLNVVGVNVDGDEVASTDTE